MIVPPGVHLLCPLDGAALIVAPRPNADSPPWVCTKDQRAWWSSELLLAAFQSWNSQQRAFLDPAVIAAVHAEWDATRRALNEPVVT